MFEIFVVSGGIKLMVFLSGIVLVVGYSIVEDYEDLVVVIGFMLVEVKFVEENDLLECIFEFGGVIESF